MAIEDYRLYIGTQDWFHPNWKDSFYPDDMPPEWALTYYSNEIPVVYLPHELDWQARVSVLLDDSNENFRFLLGVTVTESGLGADCLAAIASMADRLLGLVVQVDQASHSVAQLEKILQQLTEYRITVDLGAELPLAQSWLDSLEKYQVAPCFYEDTPVPSSCNGQLVVCFVERDCDPKGLRNIIEPCLKLERPGRELALILTSKTPSLEMLRNAKIITDLL